MNHARAKIGRLAANDPWGTFGGECPLAAPTAPEKINA